MLYVRYIRDSYINGRLKPANSPALNVCACISAQTDALKEKVVDVSTRNNGHYFNFLFTENREFKSVKMSFIPICEKIWLLLPCAAWQTSYTFDNIMKNFLAFIFLHEIFLQKQVVFNCYK